MIYARKRLGDTRHIPIFEGTLSRYYFEGVGLSTKTSERGGRIREGVPYAAPRMGLTGLDLFDDLLPELRAAFDFQDSSASSTRSTPQIQGLFFVPTAE